MKLADERQPYGRSISCAEVHLLASGVLRAVTQSWARDKRLLVPAKQLDIAFEALAN